MFIRLHSRVPAQISRYLRKLKVKGLIANLAKLISSWIDLGDASPFIILGFYFGRDTTSTLPVSEVPRASESGAFIPFLAIVKVSHRWGANSAVEPIIQPAR